MIEKGKNSGKKRDRLLVPKIFAAVSVLVILGSCAEHSSVQSSPTPIFNHPHASEYYLNNSDNYYNQVRDSQKYARGTRANETINRLLRTPVAQWLNGSIAETQSVIRENLKSSVPAGKVPVFVAYNIPNRDLGGEARGGMSGSDQYQRWVDSVSSMIGNAQSIIILEPDALANLPQIKNQTSNHERISLLRYALKKFQTNNKQTAVYLDAGNSKWLSAQTTANLLSQIDPDRNLIGGIALNVSSRSSDQKTWEYGAAIMKSLGYSLRVMIDSSRNGAPDTDKLGGWCNVKGERVGAADPIYTPDKKYEEAFIKTPGESDGRCGTSTKPAGVFDTQLFLNQIS